MKLFYCLGMVCVCLTGLPLSLCAQILPLRSYTTQDGLISNWVTAVMQDSRGYLWIGTNEGLSVYDGATFANYTTVDGLSNNFITVLTESERHPETIWIGTIQRGVTRFSNGKFTKIRVGTTPRTNNVISAAEDADGTLWVGTSAGVFRVHGDTASPFLTEGPFATDALVAKGRNRRIWVVSRHILCVYDAGGRQVASPKPRNVQNEFIEWMGADLDGDVWTGTTLGTVMVFRDTNLLYMRRVPQRTAGILVDSDGFAWLSTRAGVMRVKKADFPEGTFSLYGTERGFPEPTTWPVLEDRERNIWFQTGGNGLIKLSDRALQGFPIQVRAVAVDSNGHVWLTGRGGLLEVWRRGEEQWDSKHHGIAGMDSDQQGGQIGFDVHGNLFALSPRELVRLFRVAHTAGGPSSIHPVFTLRPEGVVRDGNLLSFFVDRNNRLWYSMEGTGVFVVDLNSRRRLALLTSPRDLPIRSVRAIFQDSHGNMWLGDYNGGLVMLPGSDWSGSSPRHFTTEDGLPDNGIRSFAEDDSGRVWIGTRYGGVAIHDGRTFQTLSIKDGLISNSIWGIARGNGGRMWLATGAGLMFVNSGDLREFGWTNEIIGTGVGFCTVDRDGVVWFSKGTRLFAYDPSRRLPNLVPPPVYITHFASNDSSMSLDERLELPFDWNNLFIQYIGISLRDEGNVRYQYRLNDANWSNATRQRSVSLAALSPGDYSFEVRAINSDGTISERPARVVFTILPPFWRQLWFLTLCAAAVLFVAAFLYRYRVNQLLKIERLRVRIASDLHDDVGTNLSSILVTSQIMERQAALSEEDRSQLKEIESIAANTQEMMRDIVWMLNPKNDSLEDFVLKMKEVAARLLQDLRYRFIVHQTLLDKVSIDFKRNVFLIFKEALNNIVRHSGASEVLIEIKQDNNTFILQIQDNGQGFEVEQRGTGIGLASLQRRASQIGGTMRLVSAAGRGTTVTLEVKNHANA